MARRPCLAPCGIVSVHSSRHDAGQATRSSALYDVLAARWRDYLIGAAAVASACLLCWHHSQPRSFLSLMINARGDQQKMSRVAYLNQLDNEFIAVGRGHSVLLRFSGFDAKDFYQNRFMETLCREGNYALCPKRAYCVRTQSPEPALTSEWYGKHDVQAVIWFVRAPDARMWSRSFRVPPGAAPPEVPPSDPHLPPLSPEQLHL